MPKVSLGFSFTTANRILPTLYCLCNIGHRVIALYIILVQLSSMIWKKIQLKSPLSWMVFTLRASPLSGFNANRQETLIAAFIELQL